MIRDNHDPGVLPRAWAATADRSRLPSHGSGLSMHQKRSAVELFSGWVVDETKNLASKFQGVVFPYYVSSICA